MMRYFNATEITPAEAHHIRLTCSASRSSTIVISLGSRWFDVRGLTQNELHKFVEQLLRQEPAAGCNTLH